MKFEERRSQALKPRSHLDYCRKLILASLLALCSTFAYANTQLALDKTETGEFGYGFNSVRTNPTDAQFEFTGNGSALILEFDGYDIDLASELAISVNGQAIGHATTTNNNATGITTIAIPESVQIAGTNTLQFVQLKPGWIWGVTNLLLTLDTNTSTNQLAINITDSNAYGHGFNGVRTNPTDAQFEFTGTGSALILEFDGYDIDIATELAISVNGQTIGYATTTSNNSIGITAITIPESVQLVGTNTLVFSQSTPGWIWGVTDLLLTLDTSGNQLTIDTADTNTYGYGFNGVRTNPSNAQFEFTSVGSALILDFDGYDIDSATELAITVNGQTIAYAATTSNNATGSSTISIPESAQISGTNTLEFVQTYPGWIWGVTNILLTLDTSSNQLTIDTADTNNYGYGFNGVRTNPTDAQFEFTGNGTALILEFDGYDIDSTTELVIVLNGQTIGYASTTSNNSIGSSSISIPASLQVSGTNTLEFVQTTPGWIWGVTNILLNSFIETFPDLSDYDLVFNDEFNAATLNADNWTTGMLWGPYLAINNEQQLYVDTLGINQDATHSPFELTGDTLIIRATPVSGSVQPPTRPDENDPIWDEYSEYRYNGATSTDTGYDSNDVEYLSGVITSYDSFKMTHGYVETRAKLPAGQGLWPAFWLLNSHYVEDSPEIDVMEFLGQDPTTIYHTYHYFVPSNNWQKISTPSYESTAADWTNSFHTFGLAWSPNALVWYVNGVEVKRITDADYDISTQAMYIISNLAVGGTWPGDADGTTPFPAEYEIDYIRAYKKKLSPTLNLSADYQLMFNDEFDGTALDTNKWNTAYLWGPYYAINNEEQYYVDAADTDQNVGYTPFTVANGTLTITAESKDNSPANVPPTALPGANASIWTEHPEFQQGPYTEAPDYTSGLITSYDSFKFVNGYAEIRAKVPAGDGLWPAFWLLNAYYVGALPEIDIMEILGESPDTAYHTYHRSDTSGVALQDQVTSKHGIPTTGYADDFHTFGVRWQPGEITWYVDDQVVGTHTEATDDNNAYQLMYVIANLAVGGNFNSQQVDATALPAKFEIDYIRVYQETDTP